MCTLEVVEGLWKHLGPLWEIFHKGLVQHTLGHACLMIVMYNGRETGNDCFTMQCLQRVNVMYMDNLAHMILTYIETIHKWVEIEMADGSKPKHKFTNLSREFMWLSLTDANGIRGSTLWCDCSYFLRYAEWKCSGHLTQWQQWGHHSH